RRRRPPCAALAGSLPPRRPRRTAPPPPPQARAHLPADLRPRAPGADPRFDARPGLAAREAVLRASAERVLEDHQRPARARSGHALRDARRGGARARDRALGRDEVVHAREQPRLRRGGIVDRAERIPELPAPPPADPHRLLQWREGRAVVPALCPSAAARSG